MADSQSALDEWLPAELAPVAMRLARADELEYQLGWACLNWSLNALKLKQLRRPDGLIDVVVSEVRPIPPVASLLFSEIINHLRAAIDNVMFYVVETLRGSPLPDDAAVKVAMPIYQSATKLLEWSNRNRNKVPEFDSSTDLYARIEMLQPYSSLAVATVISADFEPFVGQIALHGVHPLTLLQGYSNMDKHRAIRMAAARTLLPQGPMPLGQYDLTMHAVEPGFVIAEGLDTRRHEVDSTTPIHMLRPDGQIWVAPGTELAQIHTYVSDVVIPTLVTGAPAATDLPRQVGLDDTGETLESRIRAGSPTPAHERVGAEAVETASQLAQEPARALDPPE